MWEKISEDGLYGGKSLECACMDENYYSRLLWDKNHSGELVLTKITTVGFGGLKITRMDLSDRKWVLCHLISLSLERAKIINVEENHLGKI